MSDPFSVDFNQDQSNGHPHDLLARLYREIGISAVAAALEASQFQTQQAEIAPASLDARRPSLIDELQEHIAA